jgi:LPXTG-motif cell wall-anchored protein
LDSESKFAVPASGITLTGLVDGQYQLQEISPPSGYVITNYTPVTFTVAGGAITSTEGTITGVRYTAASETSDAEFIIPNEPGAALPNTGGPGTRGFLYTGLALILLAMMAGFVWRRKRA